MGQDGGWVRWIVRAGIGLEFMPVAVETRVSASGPDDVPFDLTFGIIVRIPRKRSGLGVVLMCRGDDPVPGGIVIELGAVVAVNITGA